MILRPIVPQDAALLAFWEWTSVERQERWIANERALGSLLYIAEVLDVGPVGWGQIDCDGEIRYGVALIHRRRGYGTKIAKALAYSVPSPTATIAPWNTWSQKIAEHAGLRPTDWIDERGYRYWARPSVAPA